MKNTEICIYESSMIHSSNYDFNTKTLKVEFRGGKTYVYNTVDVEDYLAFSNAKSTGQSFNDYIRKYEGSVLMEPMLSTIKE